MSKKVLLGKKKQKRENLLKADGLKFLLLPKMMSPVKMFLSAYLKK